MNKSIYVWLWVITSLALIISLKFNLKSGIDYSPIRNESTKVLAYYHAEDAYAVVHIAQKVYDINNHEGFTYLNGQKIVNETLALYNVFQNKVGKDGYARDAVRKENIKLGNVEEMYEYVQLSFEMMRVSTTDGIPDNTRGATQFCLANDANKFVNDFILSHPHIVLLETGTIGDLTFFTEQSDKNF